MGLHAGLEGCLGNWNKPCDTATTVAKTLALAAGFVLAGELVALRSASADEKALSVSSGWANFQTLGKAVGNEAPPTLTSTLGGYGRVAYEQVVSSDVSFRVDATGGGFAGGGASYFAAGSAGMALRFDVLRYVPYAVFAVGVMRTGGSPLPAAWAPVLTIGGGLDILRDRNRSWGIEGNVTAYGSDVTVMTFGVRGTTRWAFF